jgi:hypothetical protein
VDITRHKPAECTPDEIASFCRLVRGAFGVGSALQTAGDADVVATSLSDNAPMHGTLRRDGFTRAGSSCFSPRHGRMLVPFVRADRGPRGVSAGPRHAEVLAP